MDIFSFIDPAVGFAVAVLCGMGVGGGGLLVIYLTLCRSVAQLEAQATNLLFFILAASASVLSRRLTRSEFKRAALCGSCGSAGSLLGSALAHGVDVSGVRLCFGMLLIAGALAVFCGRKSSNKNSPAP